MSDSEREKVVEEIYQSTWCPSRQAARKLTNKILAIMGKECVWKLYPQHIERSCGLNTLEYGELPPHAIHCLNCGHKIRVANDK